MDESPWLATEATLGLLAAVCTFDSVVFKGATPAAYSLSYLPAGTPTHVQFDILVSANMAATTSFPSTAKAGGANHVSAVTTATLAAAPIPVNSWWALVALMLVMVDGAAVANRRHT